MGALMHVKFVAFLVHQYYWSVLGKNEKKRNDELILFNFNERVKHVSLATCWLWFVKWLWKGRHLLGNTPVYSIFTSHTNRHIHVPVQCLLWTLKSSSYWKGQFEVISDSIIGKINKARVLARNSNRSVRWVFQRDFFVISSKDSMHWWVNRRGCRLTGKVVLVCETI